MLKGRAMGWRATRNWSGLALGLLAPALGLLAPAPARAQPVAVVPPETLGEEMPAFEPPPARPRMSLAIGVGTSFDSVGFSDGTRAVPAFFAQGGFGDGLGGFNLGAFSSSAYGRYSGLGRYPDRQVGARRVRRAPSGGAPEAPRPALPDARPAHAGGRARARSRA